MSKYSIKDLERLSGIKAHTIRIWEQRYKLLSPERSDTNIRSYSNEELKRLLNVSMLNKFGVKISRIAEMSPEAIALQAASLMIRQTDHDDVINKLIKSMVDMDEPRFNAALIQSISSLGFAEAVINVIYPFLDRIGIMWQTGTINPAQEHFVSNLIRQKFIAAIDALPYQVKPGAKKILLFLNENELHELGLLFYNYLIRANGHHTIYLGQAVPKEDLLRVSEITQPDFILTMLISPLEETALNYLQELSALLPSYSICAYGTAISEEKIKSFANITIPPNPKELIKLIIS